MPRIAREHGAAERVSLELLTKLMVTDGLRKELPRLGRARRGDAGLTAFACGAALLPIHSVLYEELKLGGEGGIRTHDTG